MEIFCEKCQKKVGQINDEKIPVGKKMSVVCPQCCEKIYFISPVDFSAEFSTHQGYTPSDSPVAREQGASKTAVSTGEYSPDYDLGVMAIIREAWAKTSGVKGPIWLAITLIILVFTVFIGATTRIADFLGGGAVAAALGVASQVTLSVAYYPFIAGLLLIAIRRSANLPVNFKMAFSCFAQILPVIIASFLVMILSSLGFMLLIIPGIYLTFAYLLTIHLIIDKKMGPWQAMESSRKAINRHWFKIFWLYILMTFICFLSSIPLGIGLIWTVPMFLMVSGILYRNIFGVTQIT